jgi:hypothetical protein
MKIFIMSIKKWIYMERAKNTKLLKNQKSESKKELLMAPKYNK